MIKMFSCGSSPRAWGTVVNMRLSYCSSRFIPTGVGNGEIGARMAFRDAVHPHGRGERTTAQKLPASCLRFIPTGVGNGTKKLKTIFIKAVHPHGRGERQFQKAKTEDDAGSSPRAWGTDLFLNSGDADNAVHPHGRGERTPQYRLKPCCCGSSPRAWGTAPGGMAAQNMDRFIPTGVGNGLLTACIEAVAAVHPHGRGEREINCCSAKLWRGSSPRAWGTVLQLTKLLNQLRFIPTGVGNGRRRLTRLCRQSGSSPRAWGTAVLPAANQAISRFIPTGVGNGLSCNNGRHQSAVHPHGRGERTDVQH